MLPAGHYRSSVLQLLLQRWGVLWVQVKSRIDVCVPDTHPDAFCLILRQVHFYLIPNSLLMQTCVLFHNCSVLHNLWPVCFSPAALCAKEHLPFSPPQPAPLCWDSLGTAWLLDLQTLLRRHFAEGLALGLATPRMHSCWRETGKQIRARCTSWAAAAALSRKGKIYKGVTAPFSCFLFALMTLSSKSHSHRGECWDCNQGCFCTATGTVTSKQNWRRFS